MDAQVACNPTRRPVRRLLAGLVAALLAAAGANAAPDTPDPRTVRLKAGVFDPLATPERRAGSMRDAAAAGRAAYLVQFDGPIRATDREALRRAGARIHGYVPMMTLEVVMDPSTRAAVESTPRVRWVGVLEPRHKVSSALLRASADPERAGRPLRLRVSLFRGEEREALAAMRGLGARPGPLQRGRSFAVVEVELPAARLDSLAALPLVRYVDVLPVRVPWNDRARFHAGLGVIADDTFGAGLDPSLDGRDDASGFQVKYGHTDGGLWSLHPDFQAGLASGSISFEPGADSSDEGGHGTHTAGSLVASGTSWGSVPAIPPGSGSVSPARWRGVQPDAALHHISFENGYSDQQIFERHAEEGAQILTNSWGYADCPFPPFICSTITDYDTAAAIWDEGVWDADDDAPGLQPLVAFFAAGNDALELLNGCPLFGSGDQISSPGTAKNVITVGANETDRACGTGEGDHVGDVLFASSRGPVDPDAGGQGLFKPDLTAVGGAFVMSTERDGTGGICDGSSFDCPTHCSDTGPDYRYEAGTSMACPLAAGVGGVLLQDLVANLAVAAPKPSLVKALLINGAQDLEPSGGCGYDFDTSASQIHQGWGMVRAPEALYGAGGTPGDRRLGFENEVSERALATGESVSRTLAVAPGSPLKVTLVWTDYPAAPGAGSPLVVNDLDLEVSGPEGVFLGNDFDPMDADWSRASGVGSVPDRYNVVENVYIESAAGGTYLVTVRGFQVSQDQEPDKAGVNQDFSLVWSSPTLVRDCEDGLDNDGDGAVDLADPGCDAAGDLSERSALLACDDGVDNDGDGLVDHDPDVNEGDPGCRDAAWALEDPECSDGLNNDPAQDAFVDFDGGASAGLPPAAQTDPDPQCDGAPWKDRERRKRGCGLGFELAPLLALLARRRTRARSA